MIDVPGLCGTEPASLDGTAEQPGSDSRGLWQGEKSREALPVVGQHPVESTKGPGWSLSSLNIFSARIEVCLGAGSRFLLHQTTIWKRNFQKVFQLWDLTAIKEDKLKDLRVFVASERKVLRILIIISAFWLQEILHYGLLQALITCLVIPNSSGEWSVCQGLLPDFFCGTENEFNLEGRELERLHMCRLKWSHQIGNIRPQGLKGSTKYFTLQTLQTHNWRFWVCSICLSP